MNFLLAALISLFFASSERLTFDSIVGTGQACYTTTHGISVRTLNRKCPRKDLVEHETTRLLKRFSAPNFALRGVIITLTPVMLNSVPGGNYGEVELETGRAVVMMMDTFVKFTFVWNHELAHILIERIGENVGALHVAYSEGACELDLEACLLLNASVNMITEEPQLPTDNRFRVGWEKLTKKRINEIQKENKEAINATQ